MVCVVVCTHAVSIHVGVRGHAVRNMFCKLSALHVLCVLVYVGSFCTCAFCVHEGVLCICVDVREVDMLCVECVFVLCV